MTPGPKDYIPKERIEFMKTVMLVDDERPARELLKMLIDWKKAGFEILWEARNGKQALEQYLEK